LKTNLKAHLYHASGILALCSLTLVSSIAAPGRDVLIVTSTNSPSSNDIVVFKLTANGTPSLSLVNMLPTGGAGGASGNAGSVQFAGEEGAVANFGSNSITSLRRNGDFISVDKTINLVSGCTNPVSVALTGTQLFAVGANCVESHFWPGGKSDGTVVNITDSSAGQIAVGRTWAAVTLKSGSVLKLPLTWSGALAGTNTVLTLPGNANNTPLGAAFWGDTLGFNPAHSVDSFVLVDPSGDLFPVLGPQPAYPTNAPCWLAKGRGNIWYAGNSPGQAVSIFFSDGQGGAFYKSIPLPGTPTDITVSKDGEWLAVIYTAADGSGGRIAVFAIDHYGDLSLTATSGPISVASFNGVAISQ
jgi:hypothetical protein